MSKRTWAEEWAEEQNERAAAVRALAEKIAEQGGLLRLMNWLVRLKPKGRK